MKGSYLNQIDNENNIKITEILGKLPPFIKVYFDGIKQRTTSRTRLSYAYDLIVFFNFMKTINLTFRNYSLNQFTLNDLENLTKQDIEDYKKYLQSYLDTNKIIKKNASMAQSRKLSSIRSMFTFLADSKLISSDPAAMITMPKTTNYEPSKYIGNDIMIAMLDNMEKLESTLDGQRLIFFRKTKVRDLAIITLLFGTGIRVSECIGIDIKDIDEENKRIRISRHGCDETYVYYGDEVETTLLDLLDQRKKNRCQYANKDALWIVNTLLDNFFKGIFFKLSWG